MNTVTRSGPKNECALKLDSALSNKLFVFSKILILTDILYHFWQIGNIEFDLFYIEVERVQGYEEVSCTLQR